MLAIPTIRFALAADAAFIAAMSRDDIEFGLGWSWTQPRVLRAILDRSTNVAVICQRDLVPADSLLGFGIMHYGDDWAHLALLAISRSHRRCGLATQLISWLEKPARIAGIQRIGVEARADNPSALAFYRRRGFREEARVSGYYQGTLDAIRLVKTL